jgi:hypothetical protein
VAHRYPACWFFWSFYGGLLVFRTLWSPKLHAAWRRSFASMFVRQAPCWRDWNLLPYKVINMSITIEQFRFRLATYSQLDLEQTLLNCQQEGKPDYALEVKANLDSRFPGWDRPRTRRGGSRATIARFRGKEPEFESARAAYIWLVERFAETNPTLFSDVRWETTGYVAVGRRRGLEGAARNYFAKSPAKLFRKTPALADSQSNYHRLSNGWYVNLNLNTRENFEILCRFSAISGLSHNTDWDWEVLDPTEQLRDSKRRMEMAVKLEKEINEFLARPANVRN